MAIPFGKDTITVYRATADHETKETTWGSIVISGCCWRETQSTNAQDGTGYKGASHTVTAPQVADFSPSVGDFLVLGMNVLDIPDNEPIEEHLRGKTYFKATKSEDNTGNGVPLPHFMWGN